MNHPLLNDVGIAPELAAILRSYAAEAEKLGCLAPAQLEIIYTNGWFNLFVPSTLGGLELSLPQGVLLEEALAFIDGSLGWTVTLCAGASQFVGYLQEDIARNIFKDPAVCFAGSGMPGIANITADGYEINGYWHWATGAPHATVFTANCFIERDGKREKHEDGTDQLLSFFFLRSEVTIIETWDMMGLRATAGHSFKVSNLQVKNDRAFRIDGAHATLSGDFYQYPFLQFAATTIAANTSGMALHFLSLCEELIARKTRLQREQYTNHFQLLLDHATTSLNALRTAFYAALNASWTNHKAGGPACSTSLDMVITSSKALAQGSRRLVQDLYPYCGMMGAANSTAINRVWRDLHTASQHGLLRD